MKSIEELSDEEDITKIEVDAYTHVICNKCGSKIKVSSNTTIIESCSSCDVFSQCCICGKRNDLENLGNRCNNELAWDSHELAHIRCIGFYVLNSERSTVVRLSNNFRDYSYINNLRIKYKISE